MKTLTKKQIQDRAYYASNAERIKAQKREQYAKAEKCPKTIRAKKPVIAKAKPIVRPATNRAIESSIEKSITNRVLSARERIENRQIEKELMDWF